MNFFKLYFSGAIFYITIACSAHAQGDDIWQTIPVKEPPTKPATEQPNWFKKTLGTAIHTTENIYDNGGLSVILSAYTHHGRSTYRPEKIAKFNEKTWGLGLSKELRTEKDNEESIQFLILRDSHYKPQITATYSYQWMKPLKGKWEAGIGFSAGLVSRPDIFNSVPFPAIFPLFSIGTRDTKIVMSYIPKLPGKANGDLLFFALRVNLK